MARLLQIHLKLNKILQLSFQQFQIIHKDKNKLFSPDSNIKQYILQLKTGIISFLGQEFGKTAKPLAEYVVKKVMLKVNGLAHLSIATKYKLIMFGQTVVTAANYAPLIDVAENNAQTIKLYNEIDQLLANHMEQIIQSGAATEEVISFMSAYKCIGGLSMILPGLNYASMHDDMISKTKNHAPTHKVGFDLQTEVAKNYFKVEMGNLTWELQK
ncbi:Putative_reverse transcriptase/endonuclease [Hexamita inflata]|uniref:Putative_reverse transcriptase/endonuclease n=1 Tax=Hexamita inflata TaxID=28002 RepID=A0ABP1GV35_9EUKA